jgi:hypothetical protein
MNNRILDTHFSYDGFAWNRLHLRRLLAVVVLWLVAAPALAQYRGVTAGFGDLLGSTQLGELKARGWEVIRQCVPHETTAEYVAQEVQEIRDAGLAPVLLCTADQVALLPDGIDAEILDSPDTSAQGLEPNFRIDPVVYATRVNAAVPALQAKHIRAWAGLINTDDPNALAWLQTVLLTLDSYYGISVHRYPPGNATSITASKSGGRAKELAALKARIGTRPFAVLEWGYNQGAYKTTWQRILGIFGSKAHSHLTDAQIAALARAEFDAWQTWGATLCVWYQLYDGPPHCPQHPSYPATYIDGFGLRHCDGDGRWKPVADIWRDR